MLQVVAERNRLLRIGTVEARLFQEQKELGGSWLRRKETRDSRLKLRELVGSQLG